MKYFQINAQNIVTRSRRFLEDRVGGITIKLPFVSFSINPEAKEKELSRKLVIWMADRRVLSSKECCDDCINRSIESLGKIREKIVDNQAELYDLSDGALFLLLEFIAEGIRQFQTYAEVLEKEATVPTPCPDFWRTPEVKEKYLEALNVLREHVGQCLGQISKIADIDPPKVYDVVDFENGWHKDIYIDYDLPKPIV